MSLFLSFLYDGVTNLDLVVENRTSYVLTSANEELGYSYLITNVI